MEQIGEILNKKYNNVSNDNTDNKDIPSINVINDNKRVKKKYALDRTKFTPNTEEAMLAEELATFFDDFLNFAFYLSVVNKLGIYKTKVFFASFKDEMKEKENTKYEFRNPKKYFAWRYKKRLF